MPLNDALLKQKIIALSDEMVAKEDYETAKVAYADGMVAAIKEYLMTATLQITGTSSQGPFTGTGTIL